MHTRLFLVSLDEPIERFKFTQTHPMLLLKPAI
jgi:hypothetical protein